MEQIDLFVAGRGGYASYRIPSLAVTNAGTLLATCEARRYGPADSGDIDLVLRRSTDGGATWEPMRVIADAGPDVFGNPCPVTDTETGVVWMPMNWNLAEGDERKIVRGEAPRNVLMMWSADDGLSWSEPVDMTGELKRPDWTWYATGPGHGIRLSTGRLLIPCDFGCGKPDTNHEYFGSHVIYSDDHGASWRIGGTIQGKVNECQAVELSDGSLYLSMRSYHGRNRRAFARSTDGGETWSRPELDEALVDPVCQAGLLRLRDDHVLFSNPSSIRRENMTVRLSTDGCRSWNRGLTLHRGPSAYSDLTAAPDGTVCCLFERGDENPYERITLARIGPDALGGRAV